MQRDPLKGNLFENMVVMEAMKNRLNAGRDPRLYFYRDNHGHEVDLIWDNQRKLTPIEIKAGQTWQGSFLKGIEYFEKTKAETHTPYVIYAGSQERRSKKYKLLHYFKTEDVFFVQQLKPVFMLFDVFALAYLMTLSTLYF